MSEIGLEGTKWLVATGTIRAQEEQPTLRDRFAMAALTGLISNPNTLATLKSNCVDTAFEFADIAMSYRSSARTPNKSGE